MPSSSHSRRSVEFIKSEEQVERFGFRLGEKGTHTSRTMMLNELDAAIAAGGSDARRDDYTTQIVEHNCLAKPTVATRRLSNQRLRELYALDPAVPLFRVLRRLWELDDQGRPLLAALASVARDPLLAASASAILPLQPGDSLDRERLTRAIRSQTGERLGDTTLDKVVRNVASTWAQAGHLEGRTFKRRRRVQATPYVLTFALCLGYSAGFRGEELLSTAWVSLLDCSPTEARRLAYEAKRLGLIDLLIAGDVVSIALDRLDPSLRR